MVFIKVRCPINVNVSLGAIIEGQGGSKQHCSIPYIGSNLGVEKFLKKMEHQKRMCYNSGLRHLCTLCIAVSRKFYVKPVCSLIVFCYKKNSKSSIFYDSLSNYWLRLLSMSLWTSISLFGGTVLPPTLPYPYFDFLT